MNIKDLTIDPNSKSNTIKKLEDVKDFISVESIEIKNLNSTALEDWSVIKKFYNLKKISLSNCLIKKNSFFEGILALKKLSELCVDHHCFFEDSQEKIKIAGKFSSIKKFTFILPKKDSLDFDLPGVQKIKNNFIQQYPNFPNAFDGLEEIEFVNYENYLDKLKKNDPYNEYTEVKDIYTGVDFYNLSRLKNLKNIIFCGSMEEMLKKELIVNKIFNFPNHKKIKINQLPISEIKKN